MYAYLYLLSIHNDICYIMYIIIIVALVRRRDDIPLPVWYLFGKYGETRDSFLLSASRRYSSVCVGERGEQCRSKRHYFNFFFFFSFFFEGWENKLNLGNNQKMGYDSCSPLYNAYRAKTFIVSFVKINKTELPKLIFSKLGWSETLSLQQSPSTGNYQNHALLGYLEILIRRSSKFCLWLG